jgi:hypothetical protein
MEAYTEEQKAIGALLLHLQIELAMGDKPDPEYKADKVAEILEEYMQGNGEDVTPQDVAKLLAKIIL